MKSSPYLISRLLVVTLALATAPYFIRLGASSLWDSNEAFYAETPREMIEAADYINPRFNYQPRFNKPPLSYWVVIAFYKIFGVSESSERLAIALGAVVMLATAFVLGREIFSVEAGLLAAIALAIAPRLLMFSRRIMIDVYLAMFLGLTLMFFALAEKRTERRRLYLALMYVSAGLGVLTKGPVAILLPAAAFLIYLASTSRLAKVREMMLPAGVVIVLAIVLPWYAAVYFEHGWQHIETFILKDNLSRYTEAAWGPRRGFFFYVPVAFGDFFPWSIFLPAATWLAARTRQGEGKTWRLLAIWVAVIVIFFTFSRSKEDLYILPAYTAAAALVGGLLSRLIRDGSTRLPDSLLRSLTAMLAIIIALAGVALLYLTKARGLPFDLAGTSAIGAVAASGGAAALVLSKRRAAAVLATALTMIAINWTFVLLTLPDFERYKPVRPLSEMIREQAAPDALVGYYKFASPSMAFYLRRQVFEYYREAELEAAFRSDKEVFCLMTADDYEAVKESLPRSTYVLASRPVFQVKLRGILGGNELPQVVLISKKGGIEIAQ